MIHDWDIPRYDAVGPFTVESRGNPYLARYRCWLTTDESKKVLCEGTARDIGTYFDAVCEQNEHP